MSWLFGMNKGQDVVAPQVPTFGEGGGDDGAPTGGNQSSTAAPGGGGGGGQSGGIGSGAEGYRSEAYSFDSTALERAAKAAKVMFSSISSWGHACILNFLGS